MQSAERRTLHTDFPANFPRLRTLTLSDVTFPVGQQVQYSTHAGTQRTDFPAIFPRLRNLTLSDVTSQWASRYSTIHMQIYCSLIFLQISLVFALLP
jgi:hypothetical protein